MRILDSDQSKAADQYTISSQNITSLELMERASQAFARAVEIKYPDLTSGIIICGPGNNGGDGLALARILSESKSITVFLPDDCHKFTPDAQANLSRLPDSVSVLRGDHLKLKEILHQYDWLCDALFGSGLNRPLEGEMADLVKTMNSFNGARVSIDVPSGLLLRMTASSVAFKADWVGTFHSPKLPFFFPSHFSYVPEFTVIDIGLSMPESTPNEIEFLERSQVAAIWKKRKRFSHKGTFGHGLIMAGSEGKMGAAILATKAMLRSGVGLATVFTPKGGREILQISVPEAMHLADPEKHFLSTVPPLGSYVSIGIGPGIGTAPATADVLKKVLERVVHPFVLDADALNIISENKSLLSKIHHHSIFTPHPKEFERLAGKSASDYDVFLKAREFARNHSVMLVLKGAYTLICSPEGKAWFNSTGNPGMGTAGSGDVLTGLLTGLLTQGYSPEQACLLGVYLHGLAGDLAAAKLGENALIAGDLINEFSSAFLELEKQNRLFKPLS
ncbi:MAG TPA: NAD(P)H-hydrate dehydratase [Catalimonadaceae bacterium]|nr:NAD(P)H-hydrate dehydratase [Catalimonadaceae bacterium]